jgi:hypothetical protein
VSQKNPTRWSIRVVSVLALTMAMVLQSASAVLGWVYQGNYTGNKCYTSTHKAAAFKNFVGSTYVAYKASTTAAACVGYSKNTFSVSYQVGAYDRSADSHSAVAQVRWQQHRADTGWYNVGPLITLRNAGGAGSTDVRAKTSTVSNRAPIPTGCF